MTKSESIDREAKFLATVEAAVLSGVPSPDERERVRAAAQLGEEIRRRSSIVPVIVGETSENHRSRPANMWRRVAGVGVLAAGCLAGVMMITHNQTPQPAKPATQYSTETGERLSIVLSDGSVVQLAPQSSLTVAPEYGENTRTLLLTGEAFFEVHAQHAPFLVHTGAISTRVLGTAFNVRQYAGDDAVRVAVIEGKVMSSGQSAPVTLTAGMSGIITDSSAAVVPDNPLSVSAWRNGELVFEDAPIPQVLSAVGRWYGYTFKLADSVLAKQHVSAVFKVSARSETMKALQQLLDVRMVFDSTVVTLHPAQSARRPGTNAPTKRERDTSVSPLVAEVGR